MSPSPTTTRRSPLPAARPGADTLRHALIDSPLGPLLALASGTGLRGLWFDAQRHHPGELDAVPAAADDALIAGTRALLADYFDGRLPQAGAIAALPLDLQGTPFQRAVWQALLTIAPGATCSYGALARQLQQPGAARAVGAAVGRNPVSILVPCHRVVGEDGRLTGYAGGLDRKRFLLALEQGPDLLSSPAA